MGDERFKGGEKLGVLTMAVDGGGDDFLLEESVERVWLTVGVISVQVVRTDEGVVVDLYADGKEDAGELESTYAFNTEAEDK